MEYTFAQVYGEIINYSKELYKTSMIYLRTYFYSSHEIPFIIANLKESYKYIDKFVLCEFNYTHTGLKRDFIFEQHRNKIPKELMDKFLYFAIDMSKIAKYAYDDEKLIRSTNEKFMRGAFVKYIPIKDNDIVFAVDADEIIYNHYYPELINKMKSEDCLKLYFNQFFYKVNYFWKDLNFIGPIVAKYKVFKNDFPSKWRNFGNLYNKRVGAHFSWCQNIDTMYHKLDCQSHSPKYRQFQDKKILENAVKNKEYVFDKKRSFKLETINFDKSPLIPDSMKAMKDDFKYLIE